MDYDKIGRLICGLRKEKNMTQKQLAEQLMVSDKTISKWECGQGCPDVSILSSLSEALGVSTETLLEGDLTPNNQLGGNMKRIKFFVCPECQNILTATGETEISCCGRKLTPLIAKPAEGEHRLTIEGMETEHYVTFSHPMTKAHYISFVAYATYDRVLLVKLYPEQGAELRIPQLSRGTLYFYCTEHGLMKQ